MIRPRTRRSTVPDHPTGVLRAAVRAAVTAGMHLHLGPSPPAARPRAEEPTIARPRPSQVQSELAVARRLEFPLAVALVDLIPTEGEDSGGIAIKDIRLLVPSSCAEDAEVVIQRLEAAASGMVAAERATAAPPFDRRRRGRRASDAPTESSSGLRLPRPPKIVLTDGPLPDGPAAPPRMLPSMVQWIALIEATVVAAMLVVLPVISGAGALHAMALGTVALGGLGSAWVAARRWVAVASMVIVASTALAAVMATVLIIAAIHRWYLVGIIAPAVVAFAGLAVAHLAADWRTKGLRAWLRRLEILSTTDQLTGLANRRAWEVELRRRMTAGGNRPLSVGVLDFDHFKALNDAQGHLQGDRFLQETAAIWGSVMPADAVLARHGGEEFAILASATEDEAKQLVDHLRALVPGGETCSAGVGQWNGAEGVDGLMRRVDAALYQAKLAGRDQSRLADRHWDSQAAMLSSHWQTVVERALDNRSVIAVYQPIVRLDDMRIVAYEALARPNALQANLSVERMFATAQRMGRARDLDWLCRRAALQHAGALPPGIPVFINVSVSGLLDPLHGMDQLMLVLSWARRQPEDVVLEITEREVVRDLPRLRAVVTEYRGAGIRFAVDDVGEGHSTLEVLAAVSPHFVKIARSMVVSADQVASRSAIRAVVAFASELGAGVIAEGIETVKVAAAMEALGVDLGQGYLFGRPGPLLAADVDRGQARAAQAVRVLPSLSQSS